jgi:IPT/TIG domain
VKRRTLRLVGVVMLIAATVSYGHVAGAQGTDFFQIFFKNVDTSPNIQMGRFTFLTPLWDFGDRAGYRCAWAFLMDGGVPVARVQFDRGATYAAINDKFGPETDNDMSQCITTGDREIKPKPAGLADTVVQLQSGGATLDTLTFPETSGEDLLAWWELEQATPTYVEMELYWGEDVAIVARITSLSPSATFAVQSSASPTIGSFSPTSGPVGTAVELIGANYVEVSSVTFGGIPTTYDVQSAGRIVTAVPAGATTGPIAVTTKTGTGTSSGDFTVTGGEPPPPPEPQVHDSKVTFKLKGHLVASGRVTMPDGTDCVSSRTVLVQRRVDGRWKNVGLDLTNELGAYREVLRDRRGTYRAKVTKALLPNGDTCRFDLSKSKINR